VLSARPAIRRPDLQALFREAWALRHRRRRRRALLALIAAAAAAAIAVAVSRAGPSSPDAAAGGRAGTGTVSVASAALPRAGDYFSLASVNGRLIVSGGPDGSLFGSGATTAMFHGLPVGTCDSAIVDPATLRLRGFARASCGDPALYGERVLPIAYEWRGLPPRGGTPTMAIRVATVDRAAPGGYRLGPIVATYPQCSDCGPQWIHGDGSLWIYDPLAGGGFRAPTGMLLRVSASSGRVVQRWSMPSIVRPLIAVDGDGLWLAPTNESGEPLHTPRAALIRYRSLYHVRPGARTPAPVLDLGASGALWLVASGHTVWVETDGGPRSRLWRISGPRGAPANLGMYPRGSEQGGEFGAGAPTYAGNAAIGIYYVANPQSAGVDSTRQRIVRLAPDAAAQRTAATVDARTSELYGPSPAGVALGRSFYFIDPPTISYRGGDAPPAIAGRAVLYRVTTAR
jgi:hypothetical protein